METGPIQNILWNFQNRRPTTMYCEERLSKENVYYTSTTGDPRLVRFQLVLFPDGFSAVFSPKFTIFKKKKKSTFVSIFFQFLFNLLIIFSH
jgi:hypothetical protein